MGLLDRKAIDLKRADMNYTIAEEAIRNEKKKNLLLLGGAILAAGAIIGRLARRTFGMFKY